MKKMKKFNSIKKIKNRKKVKKMRNTKNLKKIVNNFSYVLIVLFILTITCSSIYGATDPTLVTKINSALKKIQGYLVKISLPAAGVAIASGVLIRKFSFGNEEKMAMGKKIIVNAIVGYAIVISIDLILKFVDAVI